ncbi:MAG: hypothetical protein KF690_02730 [Bacteroidetes bacterium]|nr:hypothetical protein [Bacteroidota bacterium]
MKNIPRYLLYVLIVLGGLGMMACSTGNGALSIKKSHNCVKPNNHK